MEGAKRMNGEDDEEREQPPPHINQPFA